MMIHRNKISFIGTGTARSRARNGPYARFEILRHRRHLAARGGSLVLKGHDFSRAVSEAQSVRL
jgi:hypothetical protein